MLLRLLHVSPRQFPKLSQLVVHVEDLQQKPPLQVDSRFRGVA